MVKLKDNFYNEHTAEIILFDSARKYLKEYLGENKTLAVSKWKDEVSSYSNKKGAYYR